MVIPVLLMICTNLFLIFFTYQFFLSLYHYHSNGQTTPDGKQPIILYTSANETISNSITNSYFGNNYGRLIGSQAGNTIIKDNVFYNNSLREVRLCM